jgi:hypothetical protein
MFPGGILAGTSMNKEEENSLIEFCQPLNGQKLTAVRDHARCPLSWPLRMEITIGAFVMGEWFGYEGYLTEKLVVTYRRMRTCDSNLLESLRRSDPSSSFALWLDRLS